MKTMFMNFVKFEQDQDLIEYTLHKMAILFIVFGVLLIAIGTLESWHYLS
jgi:hypothetical protein